ncbi:MAG: very short patch repair endonuclease [Bacteroides sp.]|nr:very short patch repair endonuclease [Bacteroides sp.]
MTDVMTPEERSRCMAAIHGRNTRPEMTVRKFLFAKGLRYRVNNRKLPGTPDIVLKKYRTVIFVDGCFWHGHKDCRYFRIPKSNENFWRHKINLNIARDYRNDVELRLLGWRVIRVWECSLRTADERAKVLETLYDKIVSRYDCASYTITESGGGIAAEPTESYGKR